MVDRKLGPHSNANRGARGGPHIKRQLSPVDMGPLG